MLPEDDNNNQDHHDLPQPHPQAQTDEPGLTFWDYFKSWDPSFNSRYISWSILRFAAVGTDAILRTEEEIAQKPFFKRQLIYLLRRPVFRERIRLFLKLQANEEENLLIAYRAGRLPRRPTTTWEKFKQALWLDDTPPEQQPNRTLRETFDYYQERGIQLLRAFLWYAWELIRHYSVKGVAKLLHYVKQLPGILKRALYRRLAPLHMSALEETPESFAEKLQERFPEGLSGNITSRWFEPSSLTQLLIAHRPSLWQAKLSVMVNRGINVQPELLAALNRGADTELLQVLIAYQRDLVAPENDMVHRLVCMPWEASAVLEGEDAEEEHSVKAELLEALLNRAEQLEQLQQVLSGRNAHGQSVLQQAVRHPYAIALLEVILPKMSSDLINRRCPRSGLSILQEVFQGNLDNRSLLLRTLSSAGAQIDLSYLSSGQTPLQVAFNAGNDQAVRELMALGANINLPQQRFEGVGPERRPPILHAAIRAGDNRQVRSLLALKADTNQVYGMLSPLHQAVSEKNIEALRLLLDDYRTQLETTQNNETPLAMAVRVDFAAGAELLVQYGADINAQMLDGRRIFDAAFATKLSLGYTLSNASGFSSGMSRLSRRFKQWRYGA